MMNSIFGKNIFRSLIFIALLIFIISLFWLGTKPEWVSLFPVNPPIDKLVHLIVFVFIAALLWFSSSNPRPFMIFVIATMVGVADELHQYYYIPKRTASFADFGADLIGIVLIILVLSYTQRKFTALSSKS